jgi:hypothetical protein
MPITGEVDISQILANLGDRSHGLRPAAPNLREEEREGIFRAAWGTVDMSTSVGLSVVPKFVWDVNGYYRSLDIDWPWTPTRKELREGYQRVNGQDDERLTYYFSQLLDKGVRAEYDSMPLGSRYRDRYVLEQDMHRLSDLARDLSEETGELVTATDLIEEHERERRPELALPDDRSGYVWNWGYYALRSRKYYTTDLENWQALLIKAFAKESVEVVIAIGYTGNAGKEYEIQQHDGREVFFLNENTTPTQELADTAVSTFIAQRQKG